MLQYSKYVNSILNKKEEKERGREGERGERETPI